MKRFLFYPLFLIATVVLLAGCKKYLIAKPDQKLEVPTSIADVQALLDNTSLMNLNDPATGEISADNYYLTDTAYASVPGTSQRNMYIWASDITLNDYPNHWGNLYNIVGVSNVVMESINKITPASNEQMAWNNVKGSAYLYRGKAFLAVAGLWAKAYNKASAATDPGIPLRLSSDYSVKTTRSTNEDTYQQVLSDFKNAAVLLPPHPQQVLRPSKAAAFALLARTYLMMQLYDSAESYAAQCFAISNGLLDYNTLDTSSSAPVPLFNVEDIMHTIAPVPDIFYHRARIDTTLFALYSDNDLRKYIFFQNNGDSTYSFKGSYDQSIALFDGVATDEIYLIQSECLARSGNIDQAMLILNQLLEKRFINGTFVPLSAGTMKEALSIILMERRKELVFRELRWDDIKRLNAEGLFQQTLTRKVNGQVYTLPPNDNRYALPIPQTVITISGIQQNAR